MLRLLLFCFWIFVLLSVLPLQANSQSCNDRRLSYDEIKLLAVNCTVSSCARSTNRGFTYFFPHLTINCNGSLVMWTASGELSHRVIVTNPTLIVWRINPDDPKEYKIHQRTSLLYCNGSLISPNSQQVYKCELQSGLPVQEGDVLGMEIPEYYDSDTSQFYPYFDQSSGNSMEIYIRGGTNILSFIKSSSIIQISQPLLVVDVVPDDSNTNMRDFTEAANGTVADNRKIVVEFWKMVGIAAGAFALLVVLALLVGIQCCVILRNRSKRKQSTGKGQGEYSVEPYAIVDVRGMDTPTTKSSSKSLRRQAYRIPLNRNPSYAVNISTSVGSSNSNRGRTHVVGEEILHRDSTSPKAEKAQATEQDRRENNQTVTSPDRIGRYYQSAHGLTNSDNEEESYTYVEGMRKPDELDSGIHLHQLDSTTD